MRIRNSFLLFRKFLISDSFNRPNAALLGTTDTGQPWANARTISSNITSGKALRNSGTGDYEGSVVETGRADVSVLDEIIVVGDATNRVGGGVILRYIDSNNFLIAAFNDGTPARFFLAKLEGAAFSLFGQTAAIYNDDTLYRVEVVAQGTSIQALINGNSVLTFTLTAAESEFITPTKHGIYHGSAAVIDQHDNFSIVTL